MDNQKTKKTSKKQKTKKSKNMQKTFFGKFAKMFFAGFVFSENLYTIFESVWKYKIVVKKIQGSPKSFPIVGETNLSTQLFAIKSMYYNP